ncbi:hypothetical protein PoB_000786500 [Plakobranchus ocellatus]|uniref:Uncharacterized protein n=1 Tax=Plakobranchus ocellatus TaxID=259542 RepID=A0AAV3YF29_9GAST|nr:hypothetical protein PoB_000786500 [Plakobranchus ocellatus]
MLFCFIIASNDNHKKTLSHLTEANLYRTSIDLITEHAIEDVDYSGDLRNLIPALAAWRLAQPQASSVSITEGLLNFQD